MLKILLTIDVRKYDLGKNDRELVTNKKVKNLTKIMCLDLYK